MKKYIKFALLTTIVLSFGLTLINAYAFSDEYEPYYPHITAVTRSVDEIYQRISSPDIKLPEEVVTARREMIEMYKNVGIDVSLDMENFLTSYRAIADFPQRWSTETPIPLGTSPDYSGAFSIDACWNNKIPKDAPRTYIPPAALRSQISLAVVQANIDTGGWGTGIPQIVSTPTDPYITIAAKYTTGNVNKIFMVRAREDFADYVNIGQHGDEHVMFIDGETHTGVQTWWTTIQGDPRGYTLSRHALPDYTVRAGAASVEHRLDGIGAEGQVGVNAANPPMSAFTIKSSEISSTTEMFNHAIGGAIGQMVGARVFPAISNDAYHYVVDNKGQNSSYNNGIVPYGGIIQLDPEFDTDSLYNNGKISFHLYRILKCMQEYGFYNIDTSGGEGKGSMLIYTSTYSNDWKNKDFRGFDVPYKDNTQGFSAVCDELKAILYDDWEWFGLTERPKLYVTVPVVKYADLDVNDDGVIDNIDYDLVFANMEAEYTYTTKKYDVNEDKKISAQDCEIMYNYLNDLPSHTFTWHDVSFADNDETHGRIVVAGSGKTNNGIKQYRDGMYISFGTDPENGWEFDGWTGDFEKYGKQPVVKLIMDRSYTIGAKYKKKPEINLSVKVAGPGHVEISETGILYETPKTKYGENTLVSFKAVPDEGYEFLGWAGDAKGFNNPLDMLLDTDKEVIALFGQKGYNEEFSPDNWECVSGDAEAYTVKEGKSIDFNNKAFQQAHQLIINTNKSKEFDLTGDFSIRATIAAKGVGDELLGKLIFNYKDAKNYCYVAIGGEGYFELGKVYKGVESVLKTETGEKGIVENGVIFMPKMDIEIIRKGSYLYAYGYKDGEKHFYGKVRDKSLTGGTIGIGGKWNGALSVSNIVISKTVVDETDAKTQTWTASGENVPWFERLNGAVVVAVDNARVYANDKVSEGALSGNEPYYVDKDIYVPVRYVTEKIGGKVVYDPATDSVVVSYGSNQHTFKAWTEGAQEKNGTLYVSANTLADALGKQIYKYNDVVFFSDQHDIYGPLTEPECIEFIRKIFNIKYYMGNN